LENTPLVICSLRHLKRLDLSRNAITGLPACIGNLSKLVSLDLWSNDIAEVPEEIKDLEELRFLDLRAIMFEQPEMDRIQELLPKAKVYFSQPCNCGM
jgi:Leucine-rich repeat (LRR) protein